MSNYLLGPIARAVTTGVLFAAGFAVNAAGLPVTVNGNPCGTYTNVSFDALGKLNLQGVFTCAGQTDPVDPGPTDPVDPGPTDPVDPGPTDPAVPVACGAAPDSGWGTIDHQWNLNIAANARTPISLRGLQTYSVKLINEKNAGNDVSKGKGGYGTVKTYDLPGNIGIRTLVISECPNSMVPAAPDPVAGYNPCISVGSASTSVAWSHKVNNTNITQCTLDPNKQYYVNVKHVSAPREDLTCKAGACVFLFDYSFGKSL